MISFLQDETPPQDLAPDQHPHPYGRIETRDGRRKMAKPKTQRPLVAFLQKVAEIDALLGQLTKQSSDHFGTHPDRVDWGHVGDLERVAKKLREALGEET